LNNKKLDQEVFQTIDNLMAVVEVSRRLNRDYFEINAIVRLIYVK